MPLLFKRVALICFQVYHPETAADTQQTNGLFFEIYQIVPFGNESNR